MNLVRRLGIPLAAALVAASTATMLAPIRPSVGGSTARYESELKPLVDVHELMEHVVEGTFETLKQGMADPPADAKTWRSVRDASLLLGESGNLLLFRKPNEAGAKDWSQMSIALRESGDALSKAAKAKDFQASRSAYRTLVQSCNTCHVKFAVDGEPKIEP